jgi:uncharacterized protein YggE
VVTTNRSKGKAVLFAVGLAATLILVGTLVAGCGAVSPQAGDTSSSGSLINTIIVSGVGKVTTLPDEASIQVSVQSDATTAAAALDQNSKDMQKVLDRLKAEGIKDSDIETSNVVVYPNRVYDEPTGQEKTTGYRAENTVTVTFKDLSIIGTIFAAVVDAGADQVYGPTWQLSEDNPAVATALTRAIANARSKAEAIAADQGVELGDAIIISESSASTPVAFYDYATKGTPGAGESITVPPINPQNMDVTASVTVTYRMTR